MEMKPSSGERKQWSTLGVCWILNTDVRQIRVLLYYLPRWLGIIFIIYLISFSRAWSRLTCRSWSSFDLASSKSLRSISLKQEMPSLTLLELWGRNIKLYNNMIFVCLKDPDGPPVTSTIFEIEIEIVFYKLVHDNHINNLLYIIRNS